MRNFFTKCLFGLDSPLLLVTLVSSRVTYIRYVYNVSERKPTAKSEWLFAYRKAFVSKQPKQRRLPDPSQLAFAIARVVSGDAEAPIATEKKASAVKGGLSRAKAMSAAKRSEIAKKAALARWKKPA